MQSSECGIIYDLPSLVEVISCIKGHKLHDDILNIYQLQLSIGSDVGVAQSRPNPDNACPRIGDVAHTQDI